LKNNSLPQDIVNKMLENDHFSRWLGIRVESVSEGACILKMKVRSEMMNGFNIAHGGIAFSFADSALAFASNGYNRKAVALDASVNFMVPILENDELTAVAEQLSLTHKTGLYLITVSKQDNIKVAVFKGIVYRNNEVWFENGSSSGSKP
jgi:acyl-CoA thioesterase